jgi:hypothetical protein
MNQRDTAGEGSTRPGTNRKAWERPRVTFEGNVSELVRSQNKPSGMGDSDSAGRKPTGQ